MQWFHETQKVREWMHMYTCSASKDPTAFLFDNIFIMSILLIKSFRARDLFYFIWMYFNGQISTTQLVHPLIVHRQCVMQYSCSDCVCLFLRTHLFHVHASPMHAYSPSWVKWKALSASLTLLIRRVSQHCWPATVSRLPANDCFTIYRRQSRPDKMCVFQHMIDENETMRIHALPLVFYLKVMALLFIFFTLFVFCFFGFTFQVKRIPETDCRNNRESIWDCVIYQNVHCAISF